MKKVIIIITVLILNYVYSNSQTGWFQQTSGTSYDLQCAFFLDVNTGYVVGNNGSSHVILKTTNGGINWVTQSSVYPPLVSIFFADANTGYAAGGVTPTIVIFKTSNGGLNWNQQWSGGSNTLWSIYFINSLTCFAATAANSLSGGFIFRTTDGGSSWQSIFIAGGQVLYSIYFIDQNTGYACGQPGIICKTTNSGLNWTSQTSGTTAGLRSIYFINSSTGWAAGLDSHLYKTINGGAAWSLYYNQSLCGINSVYFTNEQTGWVCGCEGAINGTTNNGATWTLQAFSSTTYLYSMSFISPLTGWAVGAGGRILKTTNGGITLIQPVSNEIPRNFSLSQNYPNPFNPATKIKFDIPNKGLQPLVQIKVFDILGSEITTLVNEQLKPGTYEVDFDGSNYPSGIYYFKLIAGEFTQTKKGVLIK